MQRIFVFLLLLGQFPGRTCAQEGSIKLYNSCHLLAKWGTFHKYQLIDGKEFIYDKDCKLQEIKVYKDGRYVGDAPIEQEDATTQPDTACKKPLASFIVYKGDTINRVDSNGRKQGHWIVFGKEKRPSGYADTAIAEQGVYSDGRKEGQWSGFYPSGKLNYVYEFHNNRVNGPCVVFREDGSRDEEGTFKNLRWVGNYKNYFPNGCLREEFNYDEKGKREGKQYYYYNCDTLMLLAWKHEGTDTASIEFSREGDTLKTVSRTHGVKVYPVKKKEKTDPPRPPGGFDPPKHNTPTDTCNGYAKLYNKTKQLYKDGVFKNCKLYTGRFLIYDKNGILWQIKLYKEGKYTGDAPVDEGK